MFLVPKPLNECNCIVADTSQPHVTSCVEINYKHYKRKIDCNTNWVLPQGKILHPSTILARKKKTIKAQQFLPKFFFLHTLELVRLRKDEYKRFHETPLTLRLTSYKSLYERASFLSNRFIVVNVS